MKWSAIKPPLWGEKKPIKNLFLHTCIYDQGDYSPLNGDLCVLHDIEERKNLMNVADRWGGGRLKPSEFKQILTLATLCPRPHCRWPRMHAFYRHLTASNSAQRITLRGTIVAALLLYRRARTHCFSPRRSRTERANICLSTLLPVMPVGPQYCNKSRRCFTLSPCNQSNYLSSIKINNSWLGWCGQRL